MKKFCESLREYVVKLINSEKREMISLTKEKYESYLNQLNCHIWRKKSSNINKLIIKIDVQLNTIVIILVNAEALNIAYVT